MLREMASAAQALLTEGPEEAARRLRRAEMKRRVELGEAARTRQEAARIAVEAVQREADAAVEKHAAAAAPLQATIRTGSPGEVAAALRELNLLNEELQRQQDDIRPRLHAASAANRAAIDATYGHEFPSRLACRDVACQRLLLALFLAKRRVAAAEWRGAVARESLRHIGGRAEYAFNGGTADEWQAELADSQAEVARALSVSDAAYRAIIEE